MRPEGIAEEARDALIEALVRRRMETVQTALTRVYAVSDPSEAVDVDPSYAESLRAAVAAAIDYGLALLAHDGEHSPPAPAILLSQARMAARNGVPLDTVLRRYFAGYRVLSDLLVSEGIDGGRGDGAPIRSLLDVLALGFDRLLAAVAAEFHREATAREKSFRQRRVERVERLLSGELLDQATVAAELSYDFDACHLGLIAAGSAATEALRDIAAPLDLRLLLVLQEEEVLWAWLGGRRPVDAEPILARATALGHEGLRLAVGEPAQGLAGWRLTHRQAAAALSIAIRGSQSVVRYADVAVVASISKDDLLSASLRQLYLAPLERGRDNGRIARETLRAYFSAQCNSASAAAALGITRQTVNNRLRAVEHELCRTLDSCASELDLALRLEEVDRVFRLENSAYVSLSQ